MRITLLTLAALVVLGGCAMDAPTPQARAEVEQANAPGGAVPASHSHPIIDENDENVPCTAYPGPGSATACVPR
jgi:hypothetical protein